MNYLVSIDDNIIASIPVEEACLENSTSCSLNLTSYLNITSESQFRVTVAAENIFGSGQSQMCDLKMPVSGKTSFMYLYLVCLRESV